MANDAETGMVDEVLASLMARHQTRLAKARKDRKADTGCRDSCRDANPYGECTCSKCLGKNHGGASLKPEHLLKLADRKLRDPNVTAEGERFWLKIIDACLIEPERQRVKRAA